MKFEFSGVEGYAEDWAYNSPGTRARTVTFFAGQYTGTGSAGQDGAVSQSFSSFNIELAEREVVIKNAFIIFETQLMGMSTTDGNVSGHVITFDADTCPGTCAGDAWGSGKVSDDQSATVLQYEDTTGGAYVRILVDVSSEIQLAAYTGAGGTGNYLSAAVGYWFKAVTTNASLINSAKAKLVITYTYDDASNSISNTVVYPLESNNATPTPDDSGSRQDSQTTDCSVDSNCPIFEYKTNIPEFSQKTSQWFEVGSFNDGNSANDVKHGINIQENNASSSFILEAAEGSGQGNWSEGWYSGVSGFSENTYQELEYYFTGSSQYLMGGEAYETYTASASDTRTRTVSYPIGVLTNGSVITGNSASASVYFAETGVSIKKAWFRILIAGQDTDAAYYETISSKVGDIAESSNWVYDFNPPGTVMVESFKIFHVISSASGEYGELAAATATSPKVVTLIATHYNANIRGLSAELMITYTYTDEDYGYLSSHQLFAGQSATAGNDTSEALTTANSVLPESTDAKTIRAAALKASYSVSCSTSNNAMSTAVVNVDADLSASGCANAFDGDSDGANSFFEFYKNVTSGMTVYDGRSYSACYTNDGASTANEGAKMNGILIYTYQLDLRPPSDPNLIRIKGNTRIKGGTRLNLEDSTEAI